MSAVNFKIDQGKIAAFQAALNAYADTRRDKGYHYCVNRTAKDVAYRAASFTHRANKSALKQMLSTYDKASSVLAGRIRKKGGNPRAVPPAKWKEMVLYLKNHTVKTVNFMRSGWLPAAKKFESLVRESAGIGKQEAFGRTDPNIPTKNAYGSIGDGTPARDVVNGMFAELTNRSVNPRNRTSWTGGLGKYGVMGLTKAIEFKTRDLLKYITDEHNRRARKEGLSG